MPTWTITQYLPPEHQAGGDSKGEILCQQDTARVTKTTREEHEAPGIWERLERQVLGDRLLSEDFSSGEESSSSSVQEVRRSCQQFRVAERGRARISQSSIGQYVCKIWWRSFQSSRFSRSPLRFGANIRAIAGGVSKSFTEDNEDFKRMAMNKSFPRTQDWIQSAQRQVKTLIDRQDAYNMQVLQDWNTFRWSRITLLSGPAAKLFRMKDHVFSDSTLCVGVSDPDPSNYWATCCWMFRLTVHRRSHHSNRIGQQNCKMYGTNMDLTNNWIWQPEKCGSFGTYYLVLSLLTSRGMFRKIWTGELQNLLMRGSSSCLCSTTLHGKAIQKLVCTMPSQNWQHLRPNSSQEIRSGVLPGTRVRKYVVARFSSVILSHPIFSSDRAIIAWTVEERREQLPFPRYIRKQQDSH